MKSLHPKTLFFLSQLKKNNNKPWFDKNKPEFDEIRIQFAEFIDELLVAMKKVDLQIGTDLKAKDCVFRIYRDVRFGKDKTPYKIHIAAAFGREGRRGKYAGYYIHIEPGGKNFMGGGVWMPEAPELKKVRQEIDYNLKDFKKITEAKSFKKTFGELDGEKMKTIPKDYDANNPAIEILKHKSFLYGCELDDKTVLSSSFLKKSVSVFTELSPFIQFLNRAMD